MAKERNPQEEYIKSWAKNYSPTICLDFDGVIHAHRYVKNYGTFYKVRNKTVAYANWAIKKLYNAGFRLIILSVRDANQIRDWLLKQNLLQYIYEINGSTVFYCNKYWKHNPENTDIKPIADLYIDDKDSNWFDKRFSWLVMIWKIMNKFPKMNWKS